MKTSLVKSQRINKKSKWNKKEVMACYAMLALPIIGFFVFTLYPILWSGKMSFFSYTGLKSSQAWMGWSNYKTLIADKTYWHSWIINLVFMFIKLPIEAFLAFITAYLLLNNTKFAGFYRSVYFMPTIVSAAIVGLVFSNMFDYFGVINANLQRFDIIDTPINWFESVGASITVVLVTTFWQSFGINVLYFVAALSGVPKEIQESAMLDGANSMVRLFKVTLPMILPVLQVVLLLSMQGTLSIGEVILILTGGAPAGNTHSVQSYLMSKIVPGFGGVADIGYMAAASIITSIICCIVALSFNKISERMKNVY